MAFNPQSVPVQPISSLTPFMGGKHWIKARAVDKGEVRTWNKPNSTARGKLFSCTFMDETASIRATFFNEAVDAFEPIIQNGQVYFVGGGSVKNANRRFNNVNNEYEVSFDKDAQIHVARDAATNIPTQRYNFVPIATLKEDNSPVDVLGVVTEVGQPGKIVTKAGQELTKRKVTIADSGASVDITFWNDDAIAFKYDVGVVLALKNVRVCIFNRVTLSAGRDSQLDPNPDIPDAQTLHRWYQSIGGVSAKLKEESVPVQPISATHIPTQRYNFVPIATLQLKEDNSPVDVLGVVTRIRQRGKIVTEAGQELTRCEVAIADSGASVGITFWNDDAIAFKYDVGAVLALKNVRVRIFKVTLSAGRDSQLYPNPDIPDTQTLHRWYQSTGGVSAVS
jgi:ssDNA-binding replication factor A large subunit